MAEFIKYRYVVSLNIQSPIETISESDDYLPALYVYNELEKLYPDAPLQLWDRISKLALKANNYGD